MMNKVQNSSESKTFLNEFIPHLVESIIYQRVNYNQNEFKKIIFNELQLDVLTTNSRNGKFKWLKKSIKDSLKLLETECLREIFILFISPNSGSIIEYYTLAFTYLEDEDVLRPILNDVSRECFEMCRLLENLSPPDVWVYEPDEVCVTLILSYYEHKIPINFSFKRFKSIMVDDVLLRDYENLFDQDTLGSFTTGFHTVKCQLTEEIIKKEGNNLGSRTI